jgi:hypothetical protein
MKRFETLFESIKVGDTILGLKKKNPNETLPDMLGGISMKHIAAIQKSDDPEKYVAETFPDKLNTSRYEFLQIYFNIDDYNKVFQYFNLNDQVYTWDIETIKLLSKRPPNLVNSICDDHYPNVYAVMSFFPDLDRNEYLKGFTLDTIYHVRKFIVTEDITTLQTGYDQEEIKRLMVHLTHLGLLERIGNTDNYFVSNSDSHRPKKRSRIVQNESYTVEEVLKNIFGSFDALRLSVQKRKLFDDLVKKYKLSNNDINIQEVDINERHKNTIYVVFQPIDRFPFKVYRFGTDSLEMKLKNSHKDIEVCLIFPNKHMFLKFHDPHPLLKHISVLSSIYYYLKIMLNTEKVNLSRTFIYNLKITEEKT